MIENTYQELEYDKQNQIVNLKNILSQENFKLLEDEKHKVDSAIKIFDKIINSNEPNKFLLNSIIEKIIIYNDKTIKFLLKGNTEKFTKNI